MATLTWRDVAAPSFAGVNQAYQGAGATLDRALSGLSDGLKQFATDRQAGVDNSLLARSLQIQDPAKMRAALASGELLQGVDLTRANPKVLEALNTRVGTLLNQASTEQGIASSKTSQAATQQNIDFSAQDQTRKTAQQQIEDAARPEQARQLGLTGALAALPTDQQRNVATTNSSLATAELGRAGQRISNATGAFNLNTNRRDDAATQASYGSAQTLLENNATVDDLRSGFLGTEFKSPQERAMVQKQLEAATGQRLFAPVGDPIAAGSGAGGAKGGKGFGTTDSTSVSSPEARDVLAELGRTMAQNSSKSTVADIEKNLGDTRSAPEIAKELSANFAGVDQGELAGLITEKMAANKNLSAADVGSALMRSTTGNYWGSTRFATDVGVDDKTFDNNLEEMAIGATDYMSAGNKTVRSFASAITKADKKLEDAKSDLIQLQIRQRSQPGIDISSAEDRVQRQQQALQDMVDKYKATPEFQPVRREPAKPAPRKPVRVPR